MAIFDTIPKLIKLIPRLASPFDGERLATLAAIERTLKPYDLNDLAAFLGGQLGSPTNTNTKQAAAGPKPKGTLTEAELNEMLDLCDEHGVDCLSERENDFVYDVRSWVSRGLTERQESWLKSIHMKVLRHTRNFHPI